MSGALKRLGKDTLIYGVGNIASRFISLLLLPFYTRYLTPNDYGILAMLSIVSFVGQQIFSLGLGPSLGIEFFKHETPSKKVSVILHAAMLMLFSALFFLLINFIFAKQIAAYLFSSPKGVELIRINSLSVALQIVSVAFSSYLQFEARSKTYTVISIITLLVSIFASIIFVVYLKFSALGILVASFIAQGVSLALLLIAFKNPLRFDLSTQTLKNILKNGIPFIPSFIALFFISQSNRFFVKSNGGIDVVGIYSIGSNFGMVMSVFVGAFTTAWFPYFMSFIDKQQILRDNIKNITNFYFLFFGGLCIFFFSFSRPLMFLMTQSFHKSFYVIGFCALSQFLLGFHTILLPPLYFSGKAASVSYVQSIVAVLSILINIVLIRPGNALIAAGISLSITYLMLVVIQFIWNANLKTVIRFDYDWRFLVKHFCWIIIAGILLVSFPLTTFGLETLISLLIGIVVAAYIFMYVFFKQKQLYLMIYKSIFSKKK